jgi:hypothetical protein
VVVVAILVGSRELLGVVVLTVVVKVVVEGGICSFPLVEL